MPSASPAATQPTGHDYSVKVDALLDRAAELGFTEADFAALAIAAADQAGASVKVQDKIAELLVVVTDEQVEKLTAIAVAQEDFDLLEACETTQKMIVSPHIMAAARKYCADAWKAAR